MRIILFIAILAVSCSNPRHGQNFAPASHEHPSRDPMSNGDTLFSNGYDSMFIYNAARKDTTWIIKDSVLYGITPNP